MYVARRLCTQLHRFPGHIVARPLCLATNNPSYSPSSGVPGTGNGPIDPASSGSPPSSGSAAVENSWSWVPPRANTVTQRDDDELIPVLKGELLTGAEIRDALERQGGEDVLVMAVKGRLDTIKEFVVASGRTPRHLRKMADSIVSALKSRGLKQAPGYTGVEGEVDDDWMLVDCYNIAVNLMLPATRKALNIESHWSTEEKPHVGFHLNSKEYDARFEEMLEQYPVPDDYARSRGSESDSSETATSDDEALVARQRHSASRAEAGTTIMEPFAMKSILKYARSRGGGSGRATGVAGRLRRKSVTKKLK